MRLSKRTFRRGGTAASAAARAVTPVRALLVAALGCAVLLGVSQFADYRGVAIGVDDYGGVEAVAPAPEIDRNQLGTAHGYAMVPLAALAAVLLALAVARGRWRLCRLVALIGIAAVAVGVLVDRPAGLDEGGLDQSFVGVEAQILAAWWVQLFAGIGLAVTALLLGGQLRRAGSGEAGGPARRGGRGKAAPRGRRRGPARRVGGGRREPETEEAA